MMQFQIKYPVFVFILLLSLPALYSQQTLSGGSTTQTLQDYPGDSIFLLPSGNTISTGGYGIVGDNSQNWQFTNRGSILAGTASAGSGIQLDSKDTSMTIVNNYGSITSQWAGSNGPAGVQFTKGGRVYNYSGASIEGFDGVHTDVGSLLVENTGSIYGNNGSGTAVYSGEGASITNFAGGEIRGLHFGISVNGFNRSAIVKNYGTIQTTNRAVYLFHGEVYALYNAPGATISGGGTEAIKLDGSKGYFLNEGTIEADNTALRTDNEVGENLYINAGTITANSGFGIETLADDSDNTIYNLATLTGLGGSVKINGDNTQLILGKTVYMPQLDHYATGSGSQLNGDAISMGQNNRVMLMDSGSEDDAFTGFHSLIMTGDLWTLSHALTLADSLQVKNGSLTLTNSLSISNPSGGIEIGNGGTLVANDSIQFSLNGSSVFKVDQGGTLQIVNTNSVQGQNGLMISGNTTFSGTVQLDGNLTINNMLALNGAILSIHPGKDTIKVSGSTDLTGGSNQIHLSDNSPGTYILLTSAGGINGSPADFGDVFYNGAPLTACNYDIITGTDSIKLVIRDTDIAIQLQPLDGTVCDGETHTFQVLASGEVLGYRWFLEGSTTPAGFTSSFQARNAGTYYVQVIGCNDTLVSRHATLTVNHAAVIINSPESTSICQGSDYRMSVSALGGELSYQWYFNGNPIPGATDTVYLIQNANRIKDYGIYKIAVQGVCGEADTSREARIWVTDKIPQPIPLDVPDVAYQGQLTEMHVGGSSGYEDVTGYTWTFGQPNEDIIAEHQSAVEVIFHTATDSQRVTATLEHACGPYTVSKDIRVELPTGVNEITDSSGPKVYPNPVTDVLYLSADETILQVMVADASGHSIYQAQPAGIEHHISVAGWTKGIYFIRVTTTQTTKVYKIVKE